MNDGVELKVVPHPEGDPLPDDFEFNSESLETVEIDIPMNEPIKELAEQAGITLSDRDGWWVAYDEDLERLVELAEAAAVAREREACAKLCEITNDGTPYNLTEQCAKAIRARGNT
jgi:hypothetical protein